MPGAYHSTIIAGIDSFLALSSAHQYQATGDVSRLIWKVINQRFCSVSLCKQNIYAKTFMNEVHQWVKRDSQIRKDAVTELNNTSGRGGEGHRGFNKSSDADRVMHPSLLPKTPSRLHLVWYGCRSACVREQNHYQQTIHNRRCPLLDWWHRNRGTDEFSW